MTFSKKSKPSRQSKRLWNWIMLVPLVAAVFAFFLIAKTEEPPAIGGPFELVMADGSAITEKALDGYFTFIYFGYTACPDVCPTSLATLSSALDAFSKDDQQKTQTLFVSVDPDRDHGEDLDDYAKTFHETFMGVTGSRAQIDQMVAAYKSYYKIDKSDDPDLYPVDHASIIYLMDRNGRYVSHFTHNAPPERIQKKLQELL
ncbi:MAG: SCO family protein [Cohaesibacter sp.]|nr:SCO family protein [Cohaesibacter sp.]